MEHDPSKTSDQSGRTQPQQPAPAPSTPSVDVAVTEQPRAVLRGEIIDTTAGVVTIIVTEDRLRLVLTEHAGRLRTLGWVAPLGIFVSLLATLVTSEFKTKHLGIKADTWHSVFVVAVIVAGVWLLAAGLLRVVRGGRRRAINDCIGDIKKTTAEGVPRLR